MISLLRGRRLAPPSFLLNDDHGDDGDGHARHPNRKFAAQIHNTHVYGGGASTSGDDGGPIYGDHGAANDGGADGGSVGHRS